MPDPKPDATPRVDWLSLAPFVAVLGLAEFAHCALLFVVVPAYVTQRLEASMTLAGATVGAYYLAEFGLKVPAGWLSDRFGRSRVIRVAVVVSVGGLGLMLTGSVAAVLAGAFVHGLGAAPLWPAVTAAAADRSPVAQRGRALGVLFTVWLISLGLGYAAANLLLPRGFGAAFLAIGAAWALAAVVAVAARESRPAELDAAPRGPYDALRALVRSLRPLGLLLAGMFTQTATVGIIVPCWREYALRRLELHESEVTIVLLLGGGVTALLLAPLGRVGDRWGPRRLLLAGLATSSAALLILPFCLSVPSVAPVVGLLGAGYALVVPAWNNIILRFIGEHERALMLSAFMSVELLGMSAGATVGGVLWDRVGPTAPFVASGVALGVLAAVYLFRLSVPSGEEEAA